MNQWWSMERHNQRRAWVWLVVAGGAAGLLGLTGVCGLQAEEQGDAQTAGRAAAKPAGTLEKRLQQVTNEIRDYLKSTKRNRATDQTNVPFMLFELEKARMLAAGARSYAFPPGDPETSLRLIEQALTLSKKGVPVYRGVTGLQERAYLSAADGSVQPYWVNVPPGYTRRKAWPMVIFLHGYDPAIDKVNAWLPSPDVLDLFARRGYLLVVPYGRRNTDFVGIGEVDTLTCLSECQRLFNIDPTRVYLAGVSMGGFGVYAVAMHYPDLFTAIAPACGRTDHYLWQHLDRRRVAGFKRLLIDADNPWDLIDNLRNLPTYLQQGQHDSLVNPEHSRRMIKELEQRGFEARYDEIPDKDHWIYFEPDCYDRMLDWFDKYTKKPLPKVVTYTTFLPKYHRAYWVTIDRFSRFGRPARIRAEAKPGNLFHVQASNVATFTLTMKQGLLTAPGKPVTVRVNGKQAFSGVVAVGHRVTVRLGDGLDESESTLRKSWWLCGPVKETYTGPFVIVYGTAGTDAADKANLASARRAAAEWQQYADGYPPVKADTALTPKELKERNLILYGDERTNSLVARMRDKLPFLLKDGTVRIGGHTYLYEKEGLGFMLCYPNPLAPDRLVVICAGRFWGDALPINHKYDLLPDFIVYDGETMYDKTNRFRCAGFFDLRWKYDPRLVWTRAAADRDEAAAGFVGSQPAAVR